MGQTLYRKYRSHSLDDIVGQSHITELLKNAIKSGQIAHAYLLTGPHGVGKTSVARILAHEINNIEYNDENINLDIIEIDAASNNSVEDIRDLRDKVMIAPTKALKKVYIIDEVHMLSKSAFNALLKTLEEPPEHVVFILATTDAEKLPATIISRTQRFNFKTIEPSEAINHLRYIADQEKINIDNDALQLIATLGRGSFRDSISLLDQLQGLNDKSITLDLVEKVVGNASQNTVQGLINAHQNNDLTTLASLLNDAESYGTPATNLTNQLIYYLRQNLAQNPNCISLINDLLDVYKSPWPYVKLLVCLSTFSHKGNLNKANVQKTTKPVTKKPELTTQIKADPPQKNTETIKQPKDSQEFPWNDFLLEIKTESAGAYSFLPKCGHTYSNQELVIYAGKPFTKKQIDKYRKELNKAALNIGFSDVSIIVLDTTKPSEDSQIATAIDIMGGGQEIIL